MMNRYDLVVNLVVEGCCGIISTVVCCRCCFTLLIMSLKLRVFIILSGNKDYLKKNFWGYFLDCMLYTTRFPPRVSFESTQCIVISSNVVVFSSRTVVGSKY